MVEKAPLPNHPISTFTGTMPALRMAAELQKIEVCAIHISNNY
jgi:hypothetical protein